MTESQIKAEVRARKREIRKAAKAAGASVTFKEWEIRLRHPSQGPCTLVLGFHVCKSGENDTYDEHCIAI